MDAQSIDTKNDALPEKGDKISPVIAVNVKQLRCSDWCIYILTGMLLKSATEMYPLLTVVSVLIGMALTLDSDKNPTLNVVRLRVMLLMRPVMYLSKHVLLALMWLIVTYSCWCIQCCLRGSWRQRFFSIRESLALSERNKQQWVEVKRQLGIIVLVIMTGHSKTD
jgi:hypothetical protein